MTLHFTHIDQFYPLSSLTIDGDDMLH